MSKFFDKIRKFWYFRLANPVVRQGEASAYRWKFRRFWLEIETLSGNFKARFTAAEHPYAALLSDHTDSSTHGFAQIMYTVGMLLTTEKKFAVDIQNAIKRYYARTEKSAKVVEDETEEMIALETEKQIQQHIELPKKERRRVERDINGRFRSAVKKVEKLAE